MINQDEIITIKCDTEFTIDQEIIIKSYKEEQEKGTLTGKLNVWSNDVTKHKQKKVVFVQIKTPAISTPRKLKANAINERERINKYINQAYIELHSDSEIVDLDISGDTNFSRFVETNKIMKTSRLVPAIPATANTPAVAIMPPEDLIDYLTAKLISLDVKYTDYYKAFYFAEDGYHISGNNLSGYTKPNVDWVVVFKSANHQTAAHEFLHSFKIPHTFTNKEATAIAECTYEAKKTDNLLDYSHNITSHPNNNKRCSLYYWQWITANNSIT